MSNLSFAFACNCFWKSHDIGYFNAAAASAVVDISNDRACMVFLWFALSRFRLACFAHGTCACVHLKLCVRFDMHMASVMRRCHSGKKTS